MENYKENIDQAYQEDNNTEYVDQVNQEEIFYAVVNSKEKYKRAVERYNYWSRRNESCPVSVYYNDYGILSLYFNNSSDYTRGGILQEIDQETQNAFYSVMIAHFGNKYVEKVKTHFNSEYEKQLKLLKTTKDENLKNITTLSQSILGNNPKQPQ